MLKQPKVLQIFVFTEMWERYGFYTILSLLIFYLIHFLHLSDKMSYDILGSITALAYGHSVLGGYIADRLIGHRRSVLLAAILVSIGYGLLALFPDLTTTYWALSLITVGTGLFKPNISSMVGCLYNEIDVRRHSGYTIFFVGINIGIILGETLAGLLQHYFGWQNLFFTTSFALLIAFTIFWSGTRFFNITDTFHSKSKQKMILSFVLIILAIIGSYYVISHLEISNIFFVSITLLCIGIVAHKAYQEKETIRQKLIAFLLLMLVSILYWALYFQMFFSINLFIERVVNRNLWGITLIPSLYPSIEAVGVIIIGSGLGWWGWRWLESSNPHLNPSIPMKFSLALVIHTIALGILYGSTLIVETNVLVIQGWLVSAYLLIALGELLISPIGLSMVVELVPRHSVGMMMGIFFITQGLGCKISGVVARLTDIPEKLLHNFYIMKHIYQHGFLIYFLASLVATLIGFSLIPIIKKLTTHSKNAPGAIHFVCLDSHQVNAECS